MTDLAAVQAWLDLVYPADPERNETHHVGAAYQPGRVPNDWTGRGYTRVRVAEAIAASDQAAPLGTYLGACTYRPGAGNARRAADAAWCFGMWSDLDIAGPGHKHVPCTSPPCRPGAACAAHIDVRSRANGGDPILPLPPDEESARKIAAASGLPEPTVWVHSGGGLYAWWLLYTPAPAADCASLAKKWQAALGRSATTLGWHYGTGVSDLARVLRVPGTVNRKVPGDEQVCRALSADGPRYALEQLAGYAEAVTPSPQPPARSTSAPGTGALAGNGVNKELWNAFTAPAKPEGPDVFGDFDARTDWAELVGQFRLGTFFRRDGDGLDCWTRDGKDSGTSFTTGVRASGADTMKVFSDAMGLPQKGTLTKHAVWAMLTQGTTDPDWKRARSELLALGYGQCTRPHPQPRADMEDPDHDESEEEEGTALPAQSRAELDVTNPAEALEWLRPRIGRGPLAGLFDRSGNVVFVAREGEAGYIPPKHDGDHDGPAQVRPATSASLAAFIDARFRCFKWVKQGEDFDAKPALFPLEAAKRVIDLPDPDLRPGLRHLAGVVHTPVVRADGSILDEPGYDPATRLYHLPDPGLVIPTVPEQPTTEQIKAAVALLDEMTAGFPWKSEHDRASFYGFLLTPLLRNLAPPPYKLFIFDAPQQGTGKTLLADLGRVLHGGVLRGGVQHGDDPELRKVITTVLARTTGPVIVFDNLTGVLDSPVLAGLLTSPDWADRLLGATEEVHEANDRVWCATANNLTVGVDLVRRVIWVGIDAQMPRPQDRAGFAIADLLGWARAHRGQLLHALLTLVRAWVAADRPAKPARSSDGFSRWTQIVDAILVHAGVPGRFADPETERQEAGEQDDEWSTFLDAVLEVFGEQRWTVKNLLDRVRTPTGAFPMVPGSSNPFVAPAPMVPLDALPGALADKAAHSARGLSAIAVSLGRWLMNRDGRFVGDLCCRSVGKDRKGKAIWQIRRLSHGSVAGVAGVDGVAEPISPYARDDATTDGEGTVEQRPLFGPSNPGTPGNPGNVATGNVSDDSRSSDWIPLNENSDPETDSRFMDDWARAIYERES